MNKSTKKYYAQGYDIEATELDDKYCFFTWKKRDTYLEREKYQKHQNNGIDFDQIAIGIIAITLLILVFVGFIYTYFIVGV